MVNPRIGSRVKQTCTVGEENPPRWCKTTRAARGRDGSPSPKGVAETRHPGVGLFDSVRWRGGLWKTQERKFGRLAESYGSGRDGKAGVKVKRVERTFVFQASRARVVRTSWIPAYAARVVRLKIEEGSGEAERRGIDQGSPPVEDSPGVVAPAKGAAAHRAPPQAKMRPRVEPLGEAEKSAGLVPAWRP